jgi:predicted AlkP superfamily pyrophosphatase or phosphodiesterase
MRSSPRSVGRFTALVLVFIAVLFSQSPSGLASAYNGHPKLVLVIIIDQFRGDYLDRYRDQFGEGGFRLFLDHGAYFSNCFYNYANTRTAPGHATLFTGAYSNGHGIADNEWWDPQTKRMVTSVEDDSTKLVGVSGDQTGASPHSLLADTLGDELKLASQGKSRVFGISMKDRAAILPAGFAANGAYWMDSQTGAFITSTYYRENLPQWVQEFNSTRPAKYWDREWKDDQGTVLRSTAHRKERDGSDAGFFEVIGSTALGNEYEFDFAKQLVANENVGRGPATDLLSISLSANDLLGHAVGPDAPEMRQMALDMDHQLADFFSFIGRQIGLANVWIALSADHGVSSLPDTVKKLHIPAANLAGAKLDQQLNAAIGAKFFAGKAGRYARFSYPLVWLDDNAFLVAHVKEEEAEKAVGEAMKNLGIRDYYTKSQLAEGEIRNDELGRQYLNSYSPLGSWFVMGVPNFYTVGSAAGTDHASPYKYDTYVPLAFYGVPFHPGTYRDKTEPIDMAPTLASLLGINPPTHSVGRVLTEALAPHSTPRAAESRP